MRPGWRIDHSCPQCGAPVELADSDRLLACGFCRVSFLMVSPDAHRYVLAPPEPLPGGAEPVYLPYWRFSGAVFSAVPFQVAVHQLDASLAAVDLPTFPKSLGLRPQAMRLRFLNPETPGRFLAPEQEFGPSLDLMQQRREEAVSGEQPAVVFHRSYIGRGTGLIYAPFYPRQGKAYDGVLKNALGPWPDLAGRPLVPASRVPWKLNFIPAICPRCGWDLQGEADAAVLVCRNCGQASAAGERGMSPVPHRVQASQGGASVHLPFWRITADVQGAALATYADLVRTVNLPRAIQPDWEGDPLYFWLPAFRTAPQMFPRLARNATVAHPPERHAETPVLDGLVAVTIPVRDAAASLTMLLAYMTVSKRRMFPELKNLKIRPRKALLVYFPFRELGREMVSDDLNISINRDHLGI